MKVFLVFLLGLLNARAFIVPKLLLPYFNQVQVNYTIKAEEGCYKWRSLNPGVASVYVGQESGEECSDTAVVVVESRVPFRKTTLLLAESELTGTVLQCDVIVDQIHRIDIISRTRELYLEDPPEKLNIRALDDEGNTFSSTAGMLFEWNLLQDDSTSSDADQQMLAHSIMSIERFIDTMYKAQNYVEVLEKEGKQSDTILISGLQTGTAYVTARMTATETVQSAKVRITVRDKVLLNPSGDVWLPQHGTIHYIVEQWRKGRPSVISLPDAQYYLQLNPQNPEMPITTFEEKTSIVVGHRKGKSVIKLMDKNLKQQTAQAFSDIYVSEPAYLKICIQPFNRWVLETGRNYVIVVELYDSDNRRLWATDNLRVVTSIDAKHFKVLDSSKNGTWHSVQTTTAGISEIHANLNAIIKQNGELHSYSPIIEARQSAEIFDPITVDPPFVVFPWQPSPVFYRRQLSARGGSGNYTWSIDNSQLAVVNSAGVVMTTVEQRNKGSGGSAVVKATDLRNPAHWGVSQVLILPASDITFTPSPREAEVGSFLDVYASLLAIVAKNKVPIVDCRESGIVWKIDDPSIFEDVPGFLLPIHESKYSRDACAGRRLKALQPGYTTISASYLQAHQDGSSSHLVVKATVAAYPPLRAIDPPSLAVLSLDSSKVLRFVGGPIRWPHWHAGYNRKIVEPDTKLLDISRIASSQNEHHVTARCLALGECYVTMSVLNKACATNPFPVHVTVQVRVSCAVPSRVETVVPPLLHSCPLHNSHALQTMALAESELVMNVTLYDSSENLFDNFTSVMLEWISTSPLTTFNEEDNLFQDAGGSGQRKHLVRQVARMPSAAGEQTVLVGVRGYKEGMDTKICATSTYQCAKIEPELSGSVSIMVVMPPSLTPTHVMLHNHVNSSQDVHITGGSGYFHHTLTQEREVVAVTDAKPDHITIWSKSGGKSLLRVGDYCLPPSIVATSDVTVAEVGSILLKVASRIEVGSWTEAEMEVFDERGSPLPARFLAFIDVTITSSTPGLATMGKPHAVSSDHLKLLSDVNAVNVGTTSLQATIATRGGRVVGSNIVHVVIFPVVELHPPVVTLIKHASYQLVIKGGPPSDYSVRFTMLSAGGGDTPINVSQSGLVCGLREGQVKVTAQVVMNDGVVFNCKAPSLVRVVQLIGVRVTCPLTRFHVGGVVPLHVEGTGGGRTPLAFGSAVPGLRFQWSAANPAVARLRTAHQEAGIDTPESMRFSMLLEGISSGHSSVVVHVTASDPSQGQMASSKFTAEVAITVFEPLRLLSAPPPKLWGSVNSLLITPLTQHKISANREGIAQDINYQVLRSGPCPPPEQPISTKPPSECDDVTITSSDCVTVSSGGVVQSGRSPCEATIRVTSVERFGVNQTLALHVLVRHVSYVIARSKTKFHLSDSALSSDAPTSFPLSSSVSFTVEQFDNRGQKFDATSHNVDLGQNRYDLIEVDPDPGNRSFTVHTPLEGSTVMSVLSNTAPSSVFYFPISAAQPIRPGNPLLIVGVRGCFSCAFVNPGGINGVWSSPSPHKVAVDPTSGAVVAMTTGQADVTYTTDAFASTTQAEVTRFRASFDRDQLPSHVTTKRYEFVFTLTSEDERVGVAPRQCGGLSSVMADSAGRMFACRVRLSGEVQAFTASVEYLSEKDQFACVINPITSSSPLLNERLAVLDDVMFVTLTSRSPDAGDVIGGELTLPFAPEFVIEMTSEIVREGGHVTLCVRANHKVRSTLQVISDNRDVITVDPAQQQNLPGTACYVISALDKAPSRNANVRVISEVTGQDETIALSVESKVSAPVASTRGQQRAACGQEQLAWMVSYEEGYRMLIYTVLAVVVSTAILIAACGVFKRLTHDVVNPPSTSFLARTPPRDVMYTPGNRSMSPSPVKTRLWSRYYEPQQAGTG